MTQSIPLIDTPDGFEAVLASIANILAIEKTLQMEKAVTAAKDPTLWDLDIYVERSNPWELFRNRTGDSVPVINVWYESSNTEKTSSTSQGRQTMPGIFHVDCLVSAVSEETENGQLSGDEVAAEWAHRTARICRRILMHPKWRSLGIDTVVHERWISDRRSYQPHSGDQPVQHARAVRLTLTVRHNENIDFETLEASEGALVTIKHDPDGPIIAQMDFDWT